MDGNTGVSFKRLQYSSECLIFFFSAAVPLTVLTIGTWCFFERRNKNMKPTGGDEENTLNLNIKSTMMSSGT
jgi:hypothetical protein